jgi:hypothetical protein
VGGNFAILRLFCRGHLGLRRAYAIVAGLPLTIFAGTLHRTSPPSRAADGLHFDPIAERALENLLEAADEIVEIDRGRISVRALVPREGIIRNHRHDEPLFILSMVA